jgi:hypothetical protein
VAGIVVDPHIHEELLADLVRRGVEVGGGRVVVPARWSFNLDDTHVAFRVGQKKTT